MKKIQILGAGGYIGRQCTEYFKANGYEVITDFIDVSDFISLKKSFSVNKPDAVINLTGAPANPTIDWCEDHKEETVKINVAGAINAVLAAIEADAYPIQISSGCIYSGGPEYAFEEDDEPNFYGSFYSRMRIVLQDALEELPVLVARIRMPVASFSHPRNFINKIASYARVISVPNSVTFLDDLWLAFEKLMDKKVTGILNLTNDGYIEHKTILAAYKKIVDPVHKYELIDLEQLHGPGGITKAGRSNCVLSNKKAKALGIKMPALDEKRLEEIMLKFKKSLS